MKKRILSLGLAVVMLLSLVLVQAGPAGAAADPSLVLSGGGVSGTYYSNVPLFDVVAVEVTDSSKNLSIPATGRFTPGSGTSTITIHSDLAIAGVTEKTKDFVLADLTGGGADELLLPDTFIGDSNITDSTALDGVINFKDVKIVNQSNNIALTPSTHYTAAEDTGTGKLKVTVTASGKTAMGVGVTHRATYKTHKYDLVTSTNTPIVTSPAPAVVQGGTGKSVNSATEAGVLTLGAAVDTSAVVVVTFSFNARDSISSVSVTSTTATNRGLGASIVVTETGANTSLFKNSVGLATAAQRDLVASRVPLLGSDLVSALLSDSVIDAAANVAIKAKITEWTDNDGDLTNDIVVAGSALTTSSKASILLANIIPVADGDSITATSGTLTDFATADLTAPSLTLRGPATASFTNVTAPVFELEVADAASGLKRAVNAIDVILKHLPGPTTLTFNEGTSPALFVSVLTTDRSFLLRPLSSTFTQGDVDWWVTVEDRVGNKPTGTGSSKGTTSSVAGTSGKPWVVTVDTEAPVISTAQTGITYNSAFGIESGYVAKSVKVKLDTLRTGPSSGFTPAPLDDTSFTKAAFRIGGLEPVAITKVDKDSVYLEVASLAADARPSAEIVSDIKDKAGNTLVVSTATSGQKLISASEDKIPPSLTLTVDSTLTKSKNKLTVKSDEALSGGIPSVTNAVPAGSGPTAGSLTTVSTTEWTREDTVNVSGVHTWTVAATDARGNAQTVVNEDLTSQIDGFKTVFKLSRKAVSSLVFTGSTNFKDADTADGGPTTGNISVSITSAAKGEVTVGPSAPKVGDKLVVGYTYNDVITFEGDKLAPTLGLLFGATALGGASVEGDITQEQADAGQKTTLRLTAAFAEAAEYTGDTRAKATVTTASLDGSDVKAKLFSTDSITYVLVTDLALGSHTLIVAGADDAGNAVTTTATFTVTARKAYEIVLSPGWNLFSLPASPAELPGADGLFGTSDDINASIGSVLRGLTKAEAVLEFDAATGSFKSSTYNAATGAWSGSVATITSDKGYWVFVSAFQTVKVALQKRGPTTALPAVKLKAGYNYVPFNTLADPVPATMKAITGGVDADVFLNSIAGSWTSLIRFDPDPAINWQVLVPNGVGWNNVNPAGPDGVLSVGADRIYCTGDDDGKGADAIACTADDAASAKDDIQNVIPNVQASRGYIIYVTKDVTLTPSQ